MVKVENFAISYRPHEDAGMVHLSLADDTGADLPIDSPQEANFLLNLLRHDSDVYYDADHQLLTTGMEVGESDD